MKPNPEVVGPYSVRSSGNIGREIVGPSGMVIAWTVDPVLAILIAELLTADDENIRSARRHSPE